MERTEPTGGPSDDQPTAAEAGSPSLAVGKSALPLAEPVDVPANGPSPREISTAPDAIEAPMAELASETPPESPRNETDLIVRGPSILIMPTASRRLTESLIVFISAILFLRAIAVEPFGVPTGSMAPTLIGNHHSATCPRCGYLFRVGDLGKQQPHDLKVSCPNCGKSDIDLSESMELAGDRLLVDKNVYSIRSPRRWEPAVFRCPSDLTKPYVKRVIGLPGERVYVYDGDVYINGHLARKTLSECRETHIPIFDMNFPPAIDGWTRRWVVENASPPEDRGQRKDPALALAGRELRLDGLLMTQSPAWIAYKHHRFDDATGLDREEVIRDGFVYNGPIGDSGSMPVHDFFVEFAVEVLGGSGSLDCRLSDGQDRVVAVCPIGSAASEFQLRQEGKSDVLRSAKRAPFQANKKYHVEMAFVDRRVSFAIDGSEPFAPYDFDACQTTRPELTSPLAIGVKGVNVVIRDLKIYRDIYYRSSGRNAVDQPLQLGSNEYFMLGDNSANSDDSRSWPIPGVPERNFLGKPFLLHQPSRMTHLTIGGRERVFQSIDWSRIRFLR